MPRKYRKAKLATRELTWADVDIRQMLDFWGGGWRGSWPTWEAYLSDWAAVRAEALPDWEEKRVEMRAHGRAQVARYAAECERAPEDRDVYEPLLAQAKEWLEEEESKELPYAEIAYQRVLAGKAPDGSDDEDEDDDEDDDYLGEGS